MINTKDKFNKGFALLSVVIVGVLLIAVLGIFGYQLFIKSNTKSNYSGPAENVTLGLSWIHEAQFAGEYYADQNGIYGNYGLNVNLIPYDYSDLVEKLTSGEYDFAILQGDSILTARSQGYPVVGIFVTFRKSPTVFFSKQESNIKYPVDFVGKKVGVAYSESIPLLAMLASTGTNPSDVEVIEREYTYEPLLSGEYDVEAGWITDIDTVEMAGIQNPNIIRAADYNANLYADVIATTEDKIKNNPDLVKRFVQATALGWQKASEDVESSALLVNKYDPKAKPEHLKLSLEQSIPLIKISRGEQIGQSSFAEWKRMYDILKNQNLLENDFDVTDAYTTKFLP